MKVLVSDPLAKEGLEILQKAEGIEVDVKTGLKTEELVACIGQYEGMIVRSETKVTKEIIEAGEKLQVIGRAGVGVDNIDLPAATKKGIVVMNAPGGNTVSTAEHTWALILALARNIPQADRSMKNKEWDRRRFMGVELAGKRLGIIGLGRIGSYVARLGLAFKMRVLAYDPFISQERAKQIGVELVELDELYSHSDYITLHLPKSEETKGMISKETIAKMKDGVRIINCARGGLIDEKALAEALKSGKVAGAALDVYEKEPLPSDSPLLELDNCITVPHLGASTIDAQTNVSIEIATQVVDALTGGPIRNAVNIQEVPPEVFQEIAPYLVLSEKIGALHTQLAVGGMKEVEVEISGEIASYEVRPFAVATLKGILSAVLKETVVNYVNAPFIAEERGIKVVEKKKMEEDFTNLLSVTLKTDKRVSQIAGSIFQKDESRIVSIDGFRIDAIPQGNMLVISNVDRPGVIGKIGTILGRNNINIAGLQMGRKAIGGKQLIVLNVDGEVPEVVLQEISSQEEILDVKLVKL